MFLKIFYLIHKTIKMSHSQNQFRQLLAMAHFVSIINWCEKAHKTCPCNDAQRISTIFSAYSHFMQWHLAKSEPSLINTAVLNA